MAEPEKDFDMKQHQEDAAAVDSALDSLVVPPEEPKKDEPQKETPPTPVTEKPVEDDFEKKLNEVKIDPSAHENVKKGIEVTRELAKAERKARLEYEAKVKEYEGKVKEYEEKLKSAPLPEEIQKELTSLRQLRRDIDIRQDPEFQQKYVQGVKDREESIMGILKEANLKPETAEWIASRGGVIAMSKSNRPVDANMTEQEWITKKLLPATPTFHQTRIVNRITEAMELQDKMQKELEDAAKNFPERQKQKLEDAAKQFEEGKNEALMALGDRAKLRTIEPGDPPEVKKNKEKHNALVAKAEKAFNEWLKTGQNPKNAAKLLVNATASETLLDYTHELENELQDLRQKYEKVKSAGRTSSLGTPPIDSKPAEKSKSDMLKQTDEQAAEQLLREMEGRK